MGGSWLEVDRSRLLGNVRVFRERVSERAKLMAVVKANAYGHGAVLVTSCIAPAVDWLGVDSVDEAEEIVDTAAGRPVLVLGHTGPKDAERLVARGIRQVLFRRDVAESLARAAKKLGKPAYVHLKVETGLHRLGVPVGDVASWATRLRELDGIVLEGVYTHFADVEDPASTFYREQLGKLAMARGVLAASGFPDLLVHAAPTAGVLLHALDELTIARVGVGLYGIWPSPETRDAATGIDLRPALAWKSRLAQVRTVSAGESVGYDRTYRASGVRRVGVVPVGYADGYDRKLSGRGGVLVRGKRAPVVGRVAMNMFMVDVTDSVAVEDDEVVLLGEQGSQSIRAEDIAEETGTIGYEVVARLSPRLRRRVVSSGS